MSKLLKKAKVYTVELDKKRPATFDFNAIVELQKVYADPFEALGKLGNMDYQALGVLLHSMFVAGAELKEIECDLKVSEVGNMVMQLMFIDQEAFNKLFETVGEATDAFFPALPASNEEAVAEESESKGGKEAKN